MAKLPLYILIAIVCVLSIFIMLKSPDMHKQTVITDSEYSFVEEDFTPRNMNFTPTQSNQNTTYNVKPQTNPRSKTTYTQPKIEYKTVYKQITPKSTPTPPNNYSHPNNTAQPERREPVQSNKIEPAQTQKTTYEPPKHELTEQEEIIAWNKWRSDLQNKVMKESKVVAPLGTQFKFSFTVDKYGNMSNIKVWSTNPSYTSQAVRVIKPVLANCQHKPILNFPQGTKRIITNVNGGFIISRVTEYSKPSDYSDYEKVKR
jgi:hypothetical protein